jgi:hypothetical protein
MEIEKYHQIIKFLRKLDGRKKTYLEDYACLIEDLIANNILLEMKLHPEKNEKEKLKFLRDLKNKRKNLTP